MYIIRYTYILDYNSGGWSSVSLNIRSGDNSRWCIQIALNTGLDFLSGLFGEDNHVQCP